MPALPVRRPRGYALIVVLTISMVLAIGTGTMLSYLASAEKTSGRQRLNREAYYVCDGIGRVVTKATVDLLADPSTFSSGVDLDAQLRSAVVGRLGPDLASVLPENYTLESPGVDGFDYRDVDVTPTFGSVAVGRFAGMSGQRRTFTYDLAIKKEEGSNCRTTATVDSMRIPFSQFAMFADEDTRYCPSWNARDITRVARFHINGDLEAGNVALPRTTLTGELTTTCNNQGPNARLRFCAADRCIESDTTREALRNTSFLTTTMFSDGRRGTSELSLAVVPQRAQHGYVVDSDRSVSDAIADDSTTNEANFRLLVDPGFNSDSPGVKSMKLAHQADIRILNGVWYLNDGTTAWPGKPIWSDHPGTFESRTSSEPEEVAINGGPADIGIDDIYSSSKPNGYSAVDGSEGGVVSYGFLRPIGTTKPQYWRPQAGGGSNQAEKVIRAAQRGFVDSHLRRDAADRSITANGNTAPGNIMPINFDLKAFRLALSNTTGSELGAELAGSTTYDPNNIIVWIGATWNGSLKGLIDNQKRPDPAPHVLRTDDNKALGVDDDDDNDAHAADAFTRLPFPMCNQDSAIADTDPRHCGNAQRVNAVRVFNAGDALPGSMRITIATSLPMYVLGSVDRESGGTPTNIPNGYFGSGFLTDNYTMDNGPDVMFAADSVTLLSDDWDDRDARWVRTAEPVRQVISRSGSFGNDVPAYNASFLVGRTLNGRAAYKQPYGLERSLRFLESYNQIGRSPVVTGSVLVGFRSVYTVAPVCYRNAIDDPTCATDTPWRQFWAPELAASGGEPPGIPAFSLRGQGETIPDSMRLNFSFFNFSFLFGF